MQGRAPSFRPISRLTVGFALVSLLAACAGEAPVIMPGAATNCLGWADAASTLRPGDELPRVVQVMGMPKRSFRVSSGYDVLEYQVGDGTCQQNVLNAKPGENGTATVELWFDGNGQYLGYNRSKTIHFWNSVKPLPIDPKVLRP